jgi:hypothetical protein
MNTAPSLHCEVPAKLELSKTAPSGRELLQALIRVANEHIKTEQPMLSRRERRALARQRAKEVRAKL